MAEMKASFQMITPKWAADILATRNNMNIRKIRNKTVAKYSRQMATGNWHNSWDGIAFDKDGNLINGQHRLMAVVKSNTTIRCLIITDAEDITGDTGLKRNTNEELKGRGINLNKDFANNMGSAIIRDAALIYFGVRDLCADEIKDYSEYPGIIKSAKICSALSSAPAGIKKASTVTAILGGYITTKDERCIEFAEILSSGFSDSKSIGPIIAIRDHLMNCRNRTGSLDSKNAQIMTQTALRAFLNGGTAKRLIKADSLVYTPNEEAFKEEW